MNFFIYRDRFVVILIYVKFIDDIFNFDEFSELELDLSIEMF